jgi:peptide deformylase
MNARVLFHENDHTNGVLYIDRVEDRYLRTIQDQLRAIKHSTQQK